MCEALEERALLSVTTGPQVVASTSGLIGTPLSTVDITFSELINRASISASDIGIVNLSQPSLTSTGSYSVGSNESISNCVVVGNRLYAATSLGLQVVDVTTPSSPTLLRTYDTPGWCYSVAVQGNYAYVADYQNGLEVIDLATTSIKPADYLVANVALSGEARDIQIAGSYAYIADYAGGLQVVSISNPLTAHRVGSWSASSGNQASSVDIVGNFAYLADGTNGLRTINISDPLNPTLVARNASSFKATNTQDVTVIGARAYLADGSNGIEIVDVSTASNPTLLGSYVLKDSSGSAGFAMGLTVVGNLALVADGHGGLQIIDVSDPTLPPSTSKLTSWGSSGWACNNVTLSGGLIYMANDTGGIQMLQFGSNISSLTRITDTTYQASLGTTIQSGNYAIVVGPDIMDLEGNRMDQDGDGLQANGGKDAYYTEFQVDIGAPPTNIGLSSQAIAENQPVSATVGTFNTTDSDSSSFTYTLVSGTGSTDNASFAIVGNTLTTTASFDYETNSAYSIRVRSKDSSDQYTEQVFTINVGNVNEAPANLTLSNSSVAENLSIGTQVGTLTTTDEDTGDTFTYQLVAGTGSGDNAMFSISGNTLLTAASFDYNAKNTYSIRMRSTDQGGLYTEKTFTIGVTTIAAGPAVVSSTSGATTHPVSSVDITFDNLINRSSVSRWDVGIVDLNNPTLSSVGLYNFSNSTTNESVSDCVVVGNRLYAATSLGLQVLDVTTPSSPTLLRTYDTSGWCYAVAVQGNYAYVADYQDGLQVIDLSTTSTKPIDWLVAHVALSGKARDVLVVDSYAYIADYEGGLQIVNVSNPLAPQLVGSWIGGAGEQVSNLDVVGNYAYLADGTHGLRIIDITNPAAPTLVSTYSNSGSNTQAVTVVGNRAYLADGINGIKVIDITSRVSPTLLGSCTLTDAAGSSGFAIGVTVVGSLALVADGNGGLQVVNVSNPASPVAIGSSTTSGWASNGVAISGGLVYMADDTGGVRMLQFGSSVSSLPRITDTTYQASLATTIQEGHYAIIVGPEITDLQGNRMDQDVDGIQGNGGKDSYYAEFSVHIGDVPTNLELSKSTVDENLAAGSTVGTFSTTDDDSTTFTYTLVLGTGSDNNSLFAIVGNTLTTTAPFNYESKNTYSIRVRSTDSTTLFVEKTLTISVGDVNETPTNITLANSNVSENQLAGARVGLLSTTDVDSGDTFTYTLVTGTGDTDNGSFGTDSNGALITATGFDYETKTSYSVRVRATDHGGLSTEKAFTITIVNANEAPTNLFLSNDTITENQAIGTQIGLFSSTDIDAGDAFTYALVFGTGSADNALFAISGDTLKSAASYDYEAKSLYSIRVRSTDKGGLYTERTFSIGVTDVNEAPTDIALSATSVAENMAAGTAVATISSTDPDPNNTFTYSLVSGAGSANNNLFVIEGSTLKTTAAFDYEAAASYGIRIRSADQSGLYSEKTFTIAVTNVNETPTDVALSNDIIVENSALGSTVGALSSTDPDAGDTFTYTLIPGTGGADNVSFTISGSSLRTATTLDYETKSAYNVRVRATDKGGLYTEQAFTIHVANTNEAPTDIALSAASVSENMSAGTAVAVISSSDPDAGNTFSYSLASGTGSANNSLFVIEGNTLKTAAAFDYETTASYSIRIRSTDQDGLYSEKAFTITVTNANETPTSIALSHALIAEGMPAGSMVGVMSTTDPDAANTFTYQLAAGTGSDDNASFSMIGNTLVTTATFNYLLKDTYYIRVRSTDQGGLYTEKAFVIGVTTTITGPTIVASTSGVSSHPLSSVTVEFNELINRGSISKWDIGVVNMDKPTVTSVGLYNFSGTTSNESVSKCVVVGNRLYAATSLGLQVLDVTTPSSPTLLRTYDTPGWCYAVAISGNYAFVADYDNGLQVIDLTTTSTKAADTMVANVPMLGQARDIQIVGNYAYVADYQGGLQIVNIANPTSPYAAGYWKTTNNQTTAIDIVGNYAYVADGVNGLQIIQMTAAANGTIATLLASTYNTPGNAQDVIVVGQYAYVADGYNGLQIINVSNPASPTLVSTCTLTDSSGELGFADGLTIVGDLALVADGRGGLQIVNISNKLNPAAVGSYETSGWACNNVALSGGLIYMADDTGGVRMLQFGVDISSLTRLTDTTYQANLSSAVQEGSYAMIVGPEITDLADYRMDQDRDGLQANGGKDAYFATFSVRIGDVPTDVGLSPTTVSENLAAGAAVGVFSTTDTDSTTFTYTLVSGTGSTNNALFTIVGDTLTTAATFDYESKNAYTIRVRSTDSTGLFLEKAMTIGIANVNEAPTAIALSSNIASESQAIGTRVGTFSSTDIDAGDTFTYSLVSGDGSADNASFNLNATTGMLTTAAVFSIATKSSYTIRVRATDAGGLFKESAFTINVSNVNEQPTELALSNNAIAENQPTGSAIGVFTTFDPDASDTHTYTLVYGTGSTDNALFTISGDTLKTGASFNYESKSLYSIRVRTTDQGGLFAEQTFAIGVTDVSEPPTDLAMSTTSLPENTPIGNTVALLSSTDPDAGNTFTYSLVSGAGSANNSLFTIVGATLKTAAAFDYETATSYNIRVRTTDQDGLYAEKAFTMTVTNVNEAPSAVALTNNTLAESAVTGTEIGTLSATDVDAGETFTYSLVPGAGGADNALFTITGASLRTAATLDYETKSAYSLRVRAADKGGLYTDQTFTINVTNVNEAPTNITLSNNLVPESFTVGGTVGALTTTDQDAGNTFIYNFVSGTGSTDNASFAISGNSIVTTTEIDFNTQTSYTIRVRSTDQDGLYFEKAFTITVTHGNRQPTDISLSNAGVSENMGAGTVVGAFSTTDRDTDDAFTYTLAVGLGDADNGSFTINANGTLVTNVSFDYETKNSYTVRVRSTDRGGLYTEKQFTVGVLDVVEVSPSTIGLYRSDASVFFLRNSNDSGYANAAFNYGAGGSGWIAVCGDWNGDGIDTVGLYKVSTSTFYLRNTNNSGYAEAAFIYTPATGPFVPVVGDWNGDGIDTIGLYNTTTSTFYLRNSNSSGASDITCSYGSANGGWTPLTGDWNGDGKDSIGLYNAATTSFFLRNSNDGGYADMAFSYGPSNRGWKPMVGDWNGNGVDTIGLYDPTTSSFYLRNYNSSGYANIAFGYGPVNAGVTPLAGSWVAGSAQNNDGQLSMEFEDSYLQGLTNTLYADGASISRADMVQILTGIGSSSSSGGTTITQSELDDCRMIVANAATLHITDSVRVLAGNVVNGNAANATYQNNTLGNLAVGDSSSKATILVDKWFRGTDHPTLTSVSYSYKTAAGSLFVSGPSITDMEQGNLGDCYLISAMGSIANANPSAIQDMIADNGDGTYTVRFYYSTTGFSNGPYVADYVTVDKQLATDGTYLVYAAYGATYANSGRRAYYDAGNELWTALVEKAYAQWNETGRASRGNKDGVNSFANIEGGSGVPLTQILGASARAYAVGDNSVRDVLKAALGAGKSVLIGTNNFSTQDGLVGSHMYVVASYSTDTFTLYNPWGYNRATGGAMTPMSLQLSWNVLYSDCDYFTVSNTAWDNVMWSTRSQRFTGEDLATDMPSALGLVAWQATGRATHADIFTNDDSGYAATNDDAAASSSPYIRVDTASTTGAPTWPLHAKSVDQLDMAAIADSAIDDLAGLTDLDALANHWARLVPLTSC